MVFKIINLTENLSEYCGLYENSIDRNVYLLPSYLKSIQKAEGYPIIIMILCDDKKMAMIPYVKKRINDISIFKDLEQEYSDIINPHEYVSAITNVPDLEDRKNIIHQLFQQIKDHCEKNNIISEFIRFNPFINLPEIIFSQYDIKKSCDNIYIDLRKNISEIWKQFHHSARKNINRAKELGLIFFKAEINKENINLFISLYGQSMQRLGANKYYYFSEEYFYSLIKECEGASLFFIRDNSSQIIAGSILLHAEEIGFHHLTGYREDSVSKRPNDYMIYSLINWGKNNNLKYLHLGGGSKNICSFKEKFSNTKIPYYVGRRIHNPKIYQFLCEKWKEENNKNEYEKFDYFPLYRFNS